jgi:hypothetical protein
MLINIDDRQHATILAALRLWQWVIEDADAEDNLKGLDRDRMEMINNIANDEGAVSILQPDEIDDLCEDLNCPDDKTLALEEPAQPEDELAARLRDYIKRGGFSCPFCGNEDIVGDSYEHEEGYVTQEISCSNCGKRWQDVLTLTDVVPLEG